MARRTMAVRQARAAAREQRRTELEHLLARLDRHTLLDTERPLIRAHVEQLLATDADLRRTIAGQQTLVQRQARQLDAAHEAIREAEQDAADFREQLRMYQAVEEQRQAEAATYAGRLDALRKQTGEALLAGAEQALCRATAAETTLDRVRDLARRMRAGSPQGAAAIYADRIEQTLDTAPEPDPTEDAPDICQFACTHSIYLHNEFGCRTLGCPCRAAAHLTASPPEQS
ncbi:hypothetical protein [Streptomyces californicus]